MGILAQLYGHARVSTKDQNTDRQYFALLEVGVPKENIYIDKTTGRKFDRKEYLKLLKRIKPKDIIIITSIDRLGRDYRAILEQWRYITQELNAHIKVLDMPILDTTKTTEGLLGTFLCDIVLQVLSYLAESTWETIRTSQRQGIDRAKQQGKHLGRPKAELPSDFENILNKWQNGDISADVAIVQLGLSRTTFYRKVKEYAEKGQHGVATP